MLSAAQSVFNHGVRAFHRREIRDALSDFRRAETLGYGANECAAYRWFCWMLLGDFEAAWLERESIASRGGSGADQLWDGGTFDGKRVVVRCLHGYGDAIQFLRYARPLREHAVRVIVQTHPEMMSLVGRIRGIDEVITWSSELPRAAWDQQIEVTELPRAFRTNKTTIPLEIPYIDVDANALAHSKAHLGNTGQPKVGLLWASSRWNPARRMRLTDLWPILAIEGVDFYSFQHGEERESIQELVACRAIHDTAKHSPEILDMAADLANMDLLITVDTMAAHLAGALGRPVWTLLPYEADWRWMLDRADSPWYPTMRLFRQKTRGDWSDVAMAAASALKEQFAAGQSAAALASSG